MQRICTETENREREARGRRIVVACRARFAASPLPAVGMSGAVARCVRGLERRHAERDGYRRADAADILCVSGPTFDRLVAEGRIRTGPDGLVPRESIEDYFGEPVGHDVPVGWAPAA